MTETPRTAVNVLVKATVPLAILVVGIVAFLLLSRLLKSEPATGSEPSDLIGVRVATVEACQDGLTIEADGIVVPYRDIDLAAEVAGRVLAREEICRAGNFVRAGTLLFTIDPEEYQLEVERLQQEHEQAIAALDELTEEIAGTEDLIEISEEQLELREKETKRWDQLAENFRNTADTDQAKVNELTAENALTTFKNRLSLLRVSRKRLESTRDLAASKLKRAELDLRRTQIRAPVDGVIIQDVVEQDSFVQRGTLLLTLEDTSRVEVKCKLEMDDLYWLWDQASHRSKSMVSEGQATAYRIPETDVEVIYHLAGRNNRQFVWKGRLARYDGLGLDEKTRTVPCRVVVDDPVRRVIAQRPSAGNNDTAIRDGSFDAVEDVRSGPPALVRGMYVTIRFHVTPQTPILEVPEIAVRPGNVVWAVRKGKLEIEPINLVSVRETAEIAAAADRDDRERRKALICVDPPNQLAAGDEVAISPLSFVRTGMDVNVLKTKKK